MSLCGHHLVIKGWWLFVNSLFSCRSTEQWQNRAGSTDSAEFRISLPQNLLSGNDGRFPWGCEMSRDQEGACVCVRACAECNTIYNEFNSNRWIEADPSPYTLKECSRVTFLAHVCYYHRQQFSIVPMLPVWIIFWWIKKNTFNNGGKIREK